MFLCFSVLSALRLPCLVKGELILALFIRFFSICAIKFCLFPLLLGVWKGFQLVIVALPGIYAYNFFYSTDCSKAVVPVLVLLFVALWFILPGD